jgi:CHAT domain-containing protein/Tfp pilus assembly protein PilF
MAAEVSALPAFGRGLSARLAGGSLHRYSLSLERGQFARIVVDQKGIDIVLSARSADGTKLAEVDAVTGTSGLESLLLNGTEAGAISIEVRSLDSGSLGGSYDIRIAELHDLTERDRTRMEAQRLTTESYELFERRTAASNTEAIGKLEDAVTMWRQAADQHGELDALLRFSLLLRPVGRHRELVQHSKGALSLARKLNEPVAEAVALNQLGLATALLGDTQEGIELLEQSLAQWRATNNRHGEAFLLNQIGGVYGNAGDPDKAISYYRKTLELSRALNERELLGGALISMGSALCDTERAAEGAKLLEEALESYRAVKDTGNQAVVLQSVTACYMMQGEPAKALAALEEALVLSRKSGRTTAVASVLSSLGSYYLRTGDLERARDALAEALQLRKQMAIPSAEAMAEARVAEVELRAGHFEVALRRSTAALDLLESVRSRIGARDTRAARMATAQQLYSTRIEILRRMHELQPGKGYDSQALHTSELARARGLLDLLNEARVDVREGVPEELLSRERELFGALEKKAAEQRALLTKAAHPVQRESVADQYRTLLSEYEASHARILKTSTRYAEIADPRPLTVDRIQHELLDPDTILLEYFVGPEQSYVWAVSTDAVAMYPLGSTKPIAAAATAVYRGLIGRQSRQGKASTESAAAVFNGSAATLSELILQPVKHHLSRSRWLVVAHGPLHYVPFATLPLPDCPGERVVEHHEIVYLPSASTLELLRQERKRRATADQTLMVMADPVFERSDPRLHLRKPGVANVVSRSRTIERMAETSPAKGSEPGWEVSRLPFTRREASSILAVAPRSGVKLAADFDASRETVLSGELVRYRYVHFATHGFYDSDFPELSGLVLSLVDSRGRPQNGFFRLHDIYKLKLSAELVVLSACQTGLGKHIRGEGLVGLTRGMLYAGAARVAASLWNVDDAATAELMQYFYEGMLQRDMAPAAALRAAQLRMLRSKRWSDPYYWAAFVMQGEPR